MTQKTWQKRSSVPSRAGEIYRVPCTSPQVWIDLGAAADIVVLSTWTNDVIDRITVVGGEQPQTGSPKLRLCYNVHGYVCYAPVNRRDLKICRHTPVTTYVFASSYLIQFLLCFSKFVIFKYLH
ncbi:hypothetical protein Zmor_005412 [Zophobas morio]|uniref:Uncharacterized protein n=1 Tax=Zophobas morio TaxID=2755281 RepID=A0AA38IVZ9_9CUCU|nr:hypothetical protein Zmor_005412 [Zophobas morio]